jgi:Integrase core domain/Transposase IS116/IS110/IS902 family
VDTSISGSRVTRVLDRVKEQRGLPQVLGTDNGPEFRSRHMDQWAYENNVKLHFIKPGTPTQNAFIESLNSQIRKRLLDIHWFINLAEVRYRAEDWRTIYNTIQRHGSLGKQTPEEFAAHARPRSATPPYVGHGQENKETILYEMDTVDRFPTVKDFISYCRLVKGSVASAGKIMGLTGGKMGNAYLRWAFGEAAVVAKRNHPLISPYVERLTSKHGKFKANAILACQLARAAYFMLQSGKPFDPERIIQG